jgi:hypothetical protein
MLNTIIVITHEIFIRHKFYSIDCLTDCNPNGPFNEPPLCAMHIYLIILFSLCFVLVLYDQYTKYKRDLLCHSNPEHTKSIQKHCMWRWWWHFFICVLCGERCNYSCEQAGRPFRKVMDEWELVKRKLISSLNLFKSN